MTSVILVCKFGQLTIPSGFCSEDEISLLHSEHYSRPMCRFETAKRSPQCSDAVARLLDAGRKYYEVIVHICGGDSKSTECDFKTTIVKSTFGKCALAIGFVLDPSVYL